MDAPSTAELWGQFLLQCNSFSEPSRASLAKLVMSLKAATHFLTTFATRLQFESIFLEMRFPKRTVQPARVSPAQYTRHSCLPSQGHQDNLHTDGNDTGCSRCHITLQTRI